MDRRTFLKRLGITGGAGVLLGMYAWQIEPFWLEFVHVKMKIPNLPSYWKGKTLMQISDVHIGTRFDPQFIRDSFKKAKAYAPDIVVYTGDFVSYLDDQQIKMLADVFTDAVLGKEGTFGILGNHDYGKNWSENEVANTIVSELEIAGVKMLRNETFNIKEFNISGIDDLWGTNFYPEKVLNHLKAEDANLVLSHNPDVADLKIWKNYNSWILSGHTHGGQVKPPFLPPPMLPVKNKRYVSGQYSLSNNRTLYINRALGHLWQVRLNVRPEITLFKLE
jgi:uncharacterized protein